MHASSSRSLATLSDSNHRRILILETPPIRHNLIMISSEPSRYDKRKAVIALHNMNRYTAQIHRDTGYPVRTVLDTIINQGKRGHTYEVTRTGRPPALSKWEKKRIVKVVENEPSSPLVQIKELAGLNRCCNTIRKFLKAEKSILHTKRHKLWMRPCHLMQRMQWCSRRQNWLVGEWRKRA